jgi:hypothetical protein
MKPRVSKLREQAWPVDDRWCGRECRIERALAAQVGNVRRTDKDLGRHGTHPTLTHVPPMFWVKERELRHAAPRLRPKLLHA